MARKPQVRASDVDALNVLLVREMVHQLRHPPVDENGNRLPIPASTLAAAIKYVQGAGIRPTPDSPLAHEVRDLMAALPFTAEPQAAH